MIVQGGSMQIPDLIKKRRNDRNYSQQELADLLETTQTVISRWETGLSTPSAVMRDRLSIHLGGLPMEYDKKNVI
jgi:transcriptional regulator with XRE-family HTH domain